MPTAADPSGSSEERLDRMERMIAALSAQITSLAGQDAGAASAGEPSPPPAAPTPGRATASAPAHSSGSAPPSAPTSATPQESPEDPFWALTALKDRQPEPGGVVYAGSVDVGLGHVEYQWGRPTDPLLRADWADRAERVAALGHPLRLALLRCLLDGEHTVAHLVDELDLASTGVAYHHLNQLQTAGWVSSPARGAWAIPPTRVVPLLTIITALEES